MSKRVWIKLLVAIIAGCVPVLIGQLLVLLLPARPPEPAPNTPPAIVDPVPQPRRPWRPRGEECPPSNSAS